MTDPQVVLQAHALRAKASIEALLHGTRRVRVQRTLLGPLWGSVVLAAIVAVVIVVAGRIVAVLHHTGH